MSDFLLFVLINCCSRDNQEFPRELYEVFMMTVLGMMMGYVYGGVPAARQARQRYIEKSGASVYSSRLEAAVRGLFLLRCKCAAAICLPYPLLSKIRIGHSTLASLPIKWVKMCARVSRKSCAQIPPHHATSS